MLFDIILWTTPKTKDQNKKGYVSHPVEKPDESLVDRMTVAYYKLGSSQKHFLLKNLSLVVLEYKRIIN